MIARRIAVILVMLVLSFTSAAGAQDFALLASGGVPPCSKHNGSREFHSSVARDDGVSAFIVGVSRRNASGCRQSAEIRIEHAGETKSYVLPDADHQDFAIVDFSPDGSKLFIADDNRGLQIAAMPISTGELRWQNVWDLLGWKDCDAIVEPLGFTPDGKLAMRSRPSVLSPPRRTNCVAATQLYALHEQSRMPTPISNAVSIKRYGKVARSPSQGCQSDPDLVGACFTVHGRLSAWNGNPAFRIWGVGTKRYFGITERPFPPPENVVIPQSLDGKLDWDVEAYGDFLLCPFTVEKPGHMQMVCVESASLVTFKRR